MKRIVVSVLSFFIAVMGVFVAPRVSYAETLSSNNFHLVTDVSDESTIENDLGEDFRESVNTNVTVPYVFFLGEFGFSPNFSTDGSVVYGREYYTVYLYVYNPTDYVFNNEDYDISSRIATYDDGEGWTDLRTYKLVYLNCTVDNKYYKFKISDFYIDYLYNAVRDYSASYDFSMRPYIVEKFSVFLNEDPWNPLLVSTLRRSFTYCGFSKGFGGSNSSSLVCADSSLSLPLSVAPVWYRPGVTNGKSPYTRDSLHSVYFSIPNEYIDVYGDAAAFQATWLNAVLAPIIVTGNQEAYDELSRYVGVDLNSVSNKPSYSLLGAAVKQSAAGAGPWFYSFGYGYNVHSLYADGLASYLSLKNPLVYGSVFYKLAGVVNSGASDNSADNYIVSSSEIKTLMSEYSSKYKGNRVVATRLDGSTYVSPYNTDLFESVDSDFTFFDTEIPNSSSAIKGIPLTFGDYSQNFFQRNTPFYNYDVDFEDIPFVHEVSGSDLTGSVSDVSQRLFIDECFVSDLRSAYSPQSHLYLLRYKVSDYVSQEASVFYKGTYWGQEAYWFSDTNAYFAQESVDLQFEILNATFVDGVRYTTLNVEMAPIDIIPDLDPPSVVTPDNPKVPSTSSSSLGVLGFVVLIIVLVVVFVFIFKRGNRMIEAIKQKRADKSRRGKKDE